MKKILQNHLNSLLVVLAFIFLALIIGAFIWGVSDIVVQGNKAAKSDTTAAQTPGFDLSDAAKLNYRGTMTQ